ncbi:unnamed protein product [Ascophyllum nodosum]
MSQKVIVIGGGYAGVEAAKSLDKNFDVTLVAGREVFTHIVAGLRSIVLPETTPRMQVPYDKLLKRGTVKRCLATKINADESTVTIASGETLPYDFLVLATGILHPKTVGVGGGKQIVAEQNAVFRKANEELKAATNILIVGGGPIGIETAGEIREEMPEKKVTLVTSKELMPSITPVFPDKFRARLCAKLEAINVTVHTDAGPVNFDKDAVDECGFIVGKRTYSWNGGEMESDLCVIATGWRHVPPLYADSKLDHWLDDRGILEVERTFEVKGAGGGGKVFAIGDCTNLPIPKIAYLAGTQGTAIAKQVAASAADKVLKGIVPTILTVSLVPVGKSGGVSVLPMGFVVGDYMTKTAKSEDMFVTKYWKELGMGKPPAVP